MKKIVILLMSLLCLCGCASGQGPKEEGTVVDHFSKTIGDVGWIVEPTITAKAAAMLEAGGGAGFPYHLERIGHPQEWDYTLGKGPFYISEAEFIGAPEYTSDAILMFAEGDNFIMDYEGNMVNPSYKGYGYYVEDAGFDAGNYVGPMCTEVYSGDFMNVLIRPALEGLCGGPLGVIEYKAALYTDIGDPYNFQVKDLLTWCLIWDPNDRIDLEKDVSLKKVGAEDLFGFRCLAPVFERYVYNSRTRYVIYDKDAKKLCDLPDSGGVWYRDFTNGFISMEKDQKYGFYSVDGQRQICAFEYDDYLPFVEGLAAVKKDDKWAYMDEEGKLLTDFIWDSVSTMYEGKVCVGLKDRFGILDLKETLNRGIPVTMESCYGSADENEAYQNAAALAAHEFVQLERDPDMVAKEEEFESKHKVIGSITPVTNSIRIRNMPSTSGEKVGVLRPYDDFGDYMSLCFYEVKENEGYTWYRIGQDRWVADGGGWYSKVLFD